ncbi:MAG: hypothetical protein HC857_01110 [Synechococcales cyanobacterium RU_4_20]|nr:hypothetical protein [Synechococcales cyanobacterium RU_4_20]NJR71328.1 hypothetical protein [Synechococcales cyanobacterium CRU_2_2]
MRIRISKAQHQKLLEDLGDRLGGNPKDGLEYVLDTWLIDGKPNPGATQPTARHTPDETDSEDLDGIVEWG